MNRNDRESNEQNRTDRGRDREPQHLKARERMRENREQNYPHEFHDRERSYRAQREDRDFKRTLDDSSWDNTPGGELSWEEQYKTDGESRNYRGKLARNNSNYTYSEFDYSGFGPRGYSRTDARIEDEVCELLARDHYIDASEIVVAVENGIVKLSGTVRQREDRVEAEMLAESIIGVEDIQNDISVRKGRQQH